ncbi:MAG: phospholipase D-like domain-containing protein [Acidobacteria bacterium]|nr:phospholipase D-like domain-containing protein [Acidobacteriota bacterium]
MRVIIQPRDGIGPLLEGIGQAKTSIEIIIYRLDRLEIEQALVEAAARGVHSRAFGVITENQALVDEAIHLFEVDAEQTKLIPVIKHLVVSPVNARPKFSKFILGAEKQLLIYDDKLNDTQMIMRLEDRVKAGVDVKVIGKLRRSVKGVEVRKILPIRLHAQAIIRDGKEVFFGSQSLRKVELDRRREVGSENEIYDCSNPLSRKCSAD